MGEVYLICGHKSNMEVGRVEGIGREGKKKVGKWRGKGEGETNKVKSFNALLHTKEKEIKLL